MAQITRHRLHSYSVFSQRFVDQSNFDVVIPPEILANEDHLETFNRTIDVIRHAYDDLRSFGCKKENARFLLPEATCTKLVMSGNMRSWRHFIEMRCDKAAQDEIRALACRILTELYLECPNIFC